jgi:hypothetical protein
VTAVYSFRCVPFALAAVFTLRFIRIAMPRTAEIAAASPADGPA